MESMQKGKIVRVGWVRKRSAYLKQWRERWMVLSTTHLCTYKSEDVNQQPTERVPISSITELSAQQSDSQNLSTFKVVTPLRVYIITSDSSASNEDWLRAIEETRQLFLQIPFIRKEELCVSRQNSEMYVFDFFNSLNALMSERLVELYQSLDETYREHIGQAKMLVDKFEEIAEGSEKGYENFMRIYRDNCMSAEEKLQFVREIRVEALDLKDLDVVLAAHVTVNIPQLMSISILRNSLRISEETVKEFKVRRTNITRALKWRYNGERIDALSFSVSKDLLLTGIGLCTPYKPSLSLQICELKLLLGPTTQSPVTYSHSEVTEIRYDEMESVRKVALEKPQVIRANSIFTLLVKASGASSYKCVDCVRTIAGPEDVVWTFMNTTFLGNDQNNRTDAVCGPIADFFYMLGSDAC